MAPGQLMLMGNSRELPVWTFPLPNRPLFQRAKPRLHAPKRHPPGALGNLRRKGNLWRLPSIFMGIRPSAISEQALHRLDDVLGSDT
jgi:hypothetical protein